MLRKLIHNSKKSLNSLDLKNSIIYRRQESLVTAAAIMMVLVLASKMLGLVRIRALAGIFGAGEQLDIYNYAFPLPDLLASFLINGAMTAAFIPVFTSYLIKNDKKEAWKIASGILSISVFIFVILGIILFVFAEFFSKLVAPGYDAEHLRQVAMITRVLIFGQLLLIVGTFFSSLLQSYQRFLVPALAPVVYNLGFIAGIFWLTPVIGIYGAAFGVVIGALLHILIQIPVAKSLGFDFNFNLSFKDTGIKKILELSLPRAVGSALSQTEWVFAVALTSFLAVGSASVLRFAFDIQNLPIGLFGLTISTAALPSLSASWAKKDKKEFKRIFLSSLHQMFFLAVPLSALFIALRIPVVRLVLGTGKFDWANTVATAETLSFFSLGVFAQGAIFILNRAFYAMHDTVTPLKVYIVSLLTFVTLSVFMVNYTNEVAYLGLAFSLSGVVSFGLQLWLLARRLNGFKKQELFYPAFKIFLSSLLMMVVIYVVIRYLDLRVVDTTRVANLIYLTIFVTVVGMSVYLISLWYLKSQELRVYLGLLRKINLSPRKPVESIERPETKF